MPPNTVRSGLPVIAVVIARLIVDGKDRGVRPFLVPMSDGAKMCTGVTSKYVSAQMHYICIETDDNGHAELSQLVQVQTQLIMR